MKPTFYSLFTGGDLAGIGAKMAGYEIMGGVEYDPAIADVARANGCPVTVGRVEDVSPHSLPSVPTVLHASPVCKNASVANNNAGETEEDRACGRAVAAWIRALQSPFVTIENVWAYRRFDAFGYIRDALDECGYWSTVHHLNSADFGVPQTRKRLILRASREGWLPPLPNKTRWVGWYEAIEDLLPSLPESEFAPWQLERLPNELKSFLMMTANRNFNDAKPGNGALDLHDPAATVTADLGHKGGSPKAFLLGDQQRQIADSERPAFTIRSGEGGGEVPKAFLVEANNTTRDATVCFEPTPTMTIRSNFGNRPANMPRAFIACGTPNDRGESVTIRPGDEPMFTVVAQTGMRQSARAWLQQGRVVKMTPRALVRFQSVPDWYELPDKQSLACTIIGNGVPSLLMQRILEPMRA